MSQKATTSALAEQTLLRGQTTLDPIIRSMAITTDRIIQETCAQAASDLLYTQRWLMDRREKEFPGHREEVNRQRAKLGLSPI